MPSTTSFDDPQFSVDITSTNPLSVFSPEFQAFLVALLNLDSSTVAPTTLVVAVDGGDYLCTLSGGGARSYVTTLRLTGQARSMTSASFYLPAELTAIHALVIAVQGLLALTATAVSVTWI